MLTLASLLLEAKQQNLNWQQAQLLFEKEQQELTQAKERVVHLLQAQQLLQEVATTLQNQANTQIAGVVTRCLRAVFGEEAYDFQILFERKRGKTEAQLLFVREGQTLDPLTSSGGGCLDVACLALRLVCLLLTTPKLRHLVIFDEPFRNLSPEYRLLVPTLLETLSQEMSVQIVLSTNFPEYECGKVVRLGRQG